MLRNAVSYSTEGGRVSLTARWQDHQVEVIVCNDGLGIPEYELTHIFEKFYRLDFARSSGTGGAGLGLAIAREIVEAHFGTIRAESDGKQTSFIIRLPGRVKEIFEFESGCGKEENITNTYGGNGV